MMLNNTSMKADIKLIMREPILVLFMLIPLMIIVVFKLMATFLVPQVYAVSGFDFSKYYGYMLAAYFLLTPGMLGTAAGFLMIDDRDSRIYDLMAVTPAGYSGYIINRLLVPLTAGFVYTLLGYYILNIYAVHFPILLYIAVLTGIEGVLTGLLLFKLAEDKVKGLTYSKALGVFTALAFADLLNMKWVSGIASLCPFYWITRLINNFDGFDTVAMAALVHIIWLGAVLRLRGRV